MTKRKPWVVLAGLRNNRQVIRFSLGIVLLVSTPVFAAGADAKTGGCGPLEGVWDYKPPSWPGRAVVARQGDKCIGVWLSRAPDAPATNPTTDTERAAVYSSSSAGVWEYTCEGSAAKLRCKGRILQSLHPDLVGAQLNHEAEMDGDNGKWWDVGPDGKRGPNVAGAVTRVR